MRDGGRRVELTETRLSQFVESWRGVVSVMQELFAKRLEIGTGDCKLNQVAESVRFDGLQLGIQHIGC